MQQPTNTPKRKPKGDIRYNIHLNEEQKEAKKIILANDITVLRGAAGSGKSLLAAAVALDLLFKREYEKIILTRPAVTSGEEIGFLPGTKDEKLAPYTAAIYDNMYRVYDKEKIDKDIQEGKIEVLPVAYMRGRNFSNVVVVCDESQNLTSRQIELLLGRMCINSKMILCGDVAQIDLKDRKQSGFDFVCKHMDVIPGFAVVTLKTNHRHPIVELILTEFKKYTD